MSVILPPTSTDSVARLLNYGHAGDAHHGDGPRAIFTAGYLCSPETAQAEMMATLRKYGKDVGFVQGLHVIDSFGLDEVDPADESFDEDGHGSVDRMAMRFDESCKKVRRMFRGNQIASYGQIDGASGKFHVHHVVCAVMKEPATYESIKHRRTDETTVTKTFEAGRSLNGELRSASRLRRLNDAWTLEHLGVDNSKRMKTPEDRRTVREIEAELDGEEMWRTTMKRHIREVSDTAASLDEFISLLDERGVSARPSNRGRPGISYGMANPKNPDKPHAVTASKLGTDFGRATLDEAFERNLLWRQREAELLDAFEKAVEEREEALEAARAAETAPKVVETVSEPEEDVETIVVNAAGVPVNEYGDQLLGMARLMAEERLAAGARAVEATPENDGAVGHVLRPAQTPAEVVVEAPEAVEPSQPVETAPEPVEDVQEPAIVEKEPVDVVAIHLAGLRETIDGHAAWLAEHDGSYRAKLESTKRLREHGLAIDSTTQELFDEVRGRGDIVTDMREDVVELEAIVEEHGSTSNEAVAAITSDAVEGRVQARQARRQLKLARLEAVLAAHREFVEDVEARRVIEQMSRDAIER